MQKISKKHYWLRQIRRPLCLALIVLIVFCHGFVSNAEVNTDLTFRQLYNISDDITSFSYLLDRNTISNYYDSLGNNWNNVLYTYGVISNNSNNSYLSNFNNTILNNSSFTMPSLYTDGSITYDLNNAYVLMNITQIPGYGNNLYVIGDGNICLIGNYFVSDNYFTVLRLSYSNSTVPSFNSVGYCNSVSENGYYCYDLTNTGTQARISAITFTDINIYYPSSDGVSGFTNFSTSSTDFSFSNENFNFNRFKSEDIIISPADPEPEPEQLDIGQHYTYANVTGNFGPTSNSSIAFDGSFQMNEYMRTHTNEYKVNFDFFVIPFITDGNHYFQIHKEYDLWALVGSGHYMVPDGSFNISARFSELVWSSGNISLQDFIISEYEQRYPSNSMSTEQILQNILNFTNGSSFSDIQNMIGEWVMNSRLGGWFTAMRAGVVITITWIGGEPEQTSGEYRMHYNTGEGTSVITNNIGNNYNPPSEYSPQYPAQITDGNGNTIINGTPVNTYLYNNLQAMVEHLFNIDASDINNIGGNMHNMYQGLVTELSNTSQSGFWGVLKQTYTFIPEEIWNWIKIVVGFLLGGTVVGWAYNGWRIKGR